MFVNTRDFDQRVLSSHDHLSLVLGGQPKDIEFPCPILSLNNLPKVCYDTSQENKVLWERFWLIEWEGVLHIGGL